MSIGGVGGIGKVETGNGKAKYSKDDKSGYLFDKILIGDGLEREVTTSEEAGICVKISSNAISETPSLKEVLDKDSLMTTSDTIVVSDDSDLNKLNINLEDMTSNYMGAASTPPLYSSSAWDFEYCNLGLDDWAELSIDATLEAKQESLSFSFDMNLEEIDLTPWEFILYIDYTSEQKILELTPDVNCLTADMAAEDYSDIQSIDFIIKGAVDSYNVFLPKLREVYFKKYIRVNMLTAKADGTPIINPSLINTADLVLKTDIVDSVDSIRTDQALSAKQGYGLNAKITTLKGALICGGSWNAETNTPDIDAIATEGHYYIVDVKGTSTLGTFSDWGVNDWAVKSVDGWAKIDNSTSAFSESLTNWSIGYLKNVETSNWETPQINTAYFRRFTDESDKIYTINISVETPGASDGYSIYSNALISELLPSENPAMEFTNRYNGAEIYQTGNSYRYYYLYCKNHTLYGDLGGNISKVNGWFNFKGV